MSTKFKPFVIDLGGHKVARADGCAVIVSFGSVGCGIDTETKNQIEQLLEDDPAVVEVEPFVIGREGEKSLCIRLDPEGDRGRLLDTLNAFALKGFRVTIRSGAGE